MKSKLLILSIVFCAIAASADIRIKDGDTVGFLGDSITWLGQSPYRPYGFVNLFVRSLEVDGVHVTPVKAGVSGNRSNDLLARLNNDVLCHNPQWMTLSCGINDVGNKPDHTPAIPLEDYKANMTAILDACAASNCQVIVLSATLLEHKELEKDWHNVLLRQYNEWLLGEAKRRRLPCIDLYSKMLAAKKADPSLKYTYDSTHLLAPGNELIATELLKLVGFDMKHLDSVKKVAWTPVTVLRKVTLKQGVAKAALDAAIKAYPVEMKKYMECREFHLFRSAPAKVSDSQAGSERDIWMLEKWDTVLDVRKNLNALGEAAESETILSMGEESSIFALEEIPLDVK